MKLIVQGTLPSLNEMINASKRNKYAYVKMKNEAIKSVTWSAIETLGRVPSDKWNHKSDYEITWYCPNMRKDKDNIMAGQKFIFDALQELGWIDNDGWKQIGDVTHKFRVDKVKPRVEIEITEVTG